MTDAGWAKLVAGLQAAGQHLAESTADLDPVERADGYRALTRAVTNLLGRLESDPELPELVPFNGWREKFFMDNPDYRYWITDITDTADYCISGNVGDSIYQSITVYSGTGVADAVAVARADTDSLQIGADGTFGLMLSRTESGITGGLELPPGATSVWVRYMHRDPNPDDPGSCRIERLGPAAPPPQPDATSFERRLAKLGAVVAQVPRVFEASTVADRQAPNQIRQWAAMAGGAAFTEPGIHYLRGAWQLEPDEALLIDGPAVACLHWNIVLYSRFLNSLDYRRRTVTQSADGTGDRLRFVLAASDPHVEGYQWLDTEGRTFGLFVLRFLQPKAEPELPEVRRVALQDLQ